MTSDTHTAGPVDQGERLHTRPGERCIIRVAAAETNGAYSVVEILSHPGDSTPIMFIRMRTSTSSFWKVPRASCAATRRSTLRPARPVALPRHIPMRGATRRRQCSG